ncbi:MAG: hypothetical protein KKH74_12765 [Gammaproteobacteria bacterium]|nr:hypothetical protein [Gammaproteobacteria bacterium]MBU1731865.1 hypothetical protein [Gammaproteobacteria bacterium]MBU1892476.1 hypothetical protein [Gammaproteobacteria bacterium]
MKPDLIMSLEGVWYSFHGGSWQASPDRPVLSGQCHILTDFDGAPAGVVTVDTKPEFAPSMIEKRVRSEGLVDGESHILVHRLIYAGGSCRVLYTAVPVVNWNAVFTWLEGESSIGLIFSVEAAMLEMARRHGAVMYRTGRQFRLLVSRSEVLSYVSTTAFSDDQDDLDIALNSLMDHAGSKLLSANDPPLYWCDLLAPESDDGSHLTSLFSQRTGMKIVTAPSSRFDSANGSFRTAAENVAGAVSWKNALNPRSERIAAAIDQFRISIAAVVALIGLGLFSVAAAWSTQAMQIQAHADRLNQETNAIAERIAGQDIPPDQLLASHAPTINFLDSLTRSANGPDPIAVLADVHHAAGKNVRVMRVQLLSREGLFRVDGMPLNGTEMDVALSGFLAALKKSGYQVNAVDPGNQSQLPGFFSYSLRRSSDHDGAR